MPRRTVAWDPIRSEGNPTRSEAVNAVIKKVKRCEVRGEGVQSAARRPIEYEEFINLLDQVHSSNDKGAIKYLVSAVLTLQWHLIARIDDMMKMKFDSFSCSIHHPGTLNCQLRWSKNISEERDAPEQIVLGSMNPRVCVLLNLAVHVETTDSIAVSPYVFGNAQDGDRVIRRFLQDIFDGADFHKLKPGNLGTHSLRKGAATWRTRKNVVDVYIDNTQPYPDAIAAGRLASPLGPCCYTLQEGVQAVTIDLLVNHIGPAIKEVMGEGVARVLALPLLWASLVPSGSFDYDLVQIALKQRVIQAYIDAGDNTAVNPVKRVPFHIVGDGAQLQLLIQGITASDNMRKEFAAVHSQLFGMQHQIANVLNGVLRLRTESQRNKQKVMAVLRRIALQPAAHLYELWGEYEFGLNGVKAAREYTAAERGANKFAYSRRKMFWDVVATMVRAGYSSDVAVDRIYAIYGRQLPVTSILLALRRDKQQGGHPSLRL
ncbi:hypothetical protein PPTG_17274 [Phytophthora nicotianae INRA-310]|uniref:Uncharacterized protein n=1 Tax=Phytophthora nicotianae (strain INRA-310) TaxID=761204 RepID=W2PIW4_PHYN3|nr:hypothetical protein PPTG_17274 [Phytophthora nicotianae INRA-310]ETN00948.1 hypothetical protein PPTG_17274 [Phytophthora nicotianae INRA-310]